MSQFVSKLCRNSIFKNSAKTVQDWISVGFVFNLNKYNVN